MPQIRLFPFQRSQFDFARKTSTRYRAIFLKLANFDVNQIYWSNTDLSFQNPCFTRLNEKYSGPLQKIKQSEYNFLGQRVRQFNQVFDIISIFASNSISPPPPPLKKPHFDFSEKHEQTTGIRDFRIAHIENQMR